MRFAGLATQVPTTTRSLYFSEQSIGTNGGTQFFITVQGQKPRVFHMSDPPAIVTNTGAVEDWTIENHSGEVHAFHIHQIHFLVMAINGVPVPNPDLQDTVIVPNWTGSGPYPSVTLRMDFRDPNIAGTFVYHCHILDHEDGGMMAKIQVNRVELEDRDTSPPAAYCAAAPSRFRASPAAILNIVPSGFFPGMLPPLIAVP